MTTPGYNADAKPASPGDRQGSSGSALRVTIAVTRQHPYIGEWFRRPDGDSAHDQVVRKWREHQVIARALRSVKYIRREHYLRNLLSEAKGWLEQDDERLDARWAEVVSSAAWASFPQSVRDLYAALHAKAAERGSLGGPCVLLGHRQAMALIEAMTGRRYNSLATITKARLVLIEANLITVKVGQARQPGFMSKATVYNLLPDASEQCLYPHKGIVHSEAGEARPVLTDRERKILLASFDGIAAARQVMEAEANLAAIFAEQEPPAAVVVAQDDDWMAMPAASHPRRVLILPSPPVLTGQRLSGVDDAIAAAEERSGDGERAGHAA